MSLGAKLAVNWHVLSPLLDEALELPTAHRLAWLEALTGENQPFKTELGRLLSIDPCSSAAYPSSSENVPGDSIGPWRLIQKIGEGGMATVWMAERADGLLEKKAAVKLPRAGWHNTLFCHRLDRERCFLDALDHPNIARLLDAGVTPSGQPYLALEYVEGIRIDEYFEARDLPVTARIEIFLQVIQAIAFAHHSLVLHRDLKPSNILISSAGAARVLDFGIAKLLENGQAQETDLTLFAGRALTLDYASPEQIMGEPLTVASDIYALGVILYELLTGRRPYRLKRNSAAALEEQILEVEPPPPSEVVVDRRIRRALRGDLDRVVLKALKKEPAARYSTAEAFADDLRRYLARRPVLAQPDRTSYRILMFGRRHRVGVLIASLLFLTLLSASILIAWQVHAALVQKRRAEQAKTLLLSLLFDAHAYQGVGKPVYALDLLKQMQQRLAGLPASDAETRLPILNILGASLLSQQDIDDAEATINRAAHDAATLSPSNPQRLRAEMLRCWILLFRGETSKVRGEVDRLLAQMKLYQSALPEDFAGAWRIRSAVALEDHDAPTAIASAHAALQIAETRLGVRHNQAVLGLVDLCTAQQLAGELPRALETCQNALNRALNAYSHSATHPNVLKARVAFALALARCGQLSRAINLVQSAVDDSVALFGSSSRLTAVHRKSLAELQMQAHRWQEARRNIEESQSVLSRILRPESPAYLSLQAQRARLRATKGRETLRRLFGGRSIPRPFCACCSEDLRAGIKLHQSNPGAAHRPRRRLLSQ